VAPELPLKPFDLRPHPVRARLLLDVLLGQPTLKVRDELLLRGDQRRSTRKRGPEAWTGERARVAKE
jgi:hypothetical protein